MIFLFSHENCEKAKVLRSRLQKTGLPFSDREVDTEDGEKWFMRFFFYNFNSKTQLVSPILAVGGERLPYGDGQERSIENFFRNKCLEE